MSVRKNTILDVFECVYYVGESHILICNDKWFRVQPLQKKKNDKNFKQIEKKNPKKLYKKSVNKF